MAHEDAIAELRRQLEALPLPTERPIRPISLDWRRVIFSCSHDMTGRDTDCVDFAAIISRSCRAARLDRLIIHPDTEAAWIVTEIRLGDTIVPSPRFVGGVWRWSDVYWKSSRFDWAAGMPIELQIRRKAPGLDIFNGVLFADVDEADRVPARSG